MSGYGAVTRVFRPSVKAYAKNSLVMAAIGIPVLVSLVLINPRTRHLAWVLGIAAVASIAGVLLYMAWARVFVTADYIGKRGFGATRWTPKAAVQRTLLVRRLTDGAGVNRTELFLFAPDGVRLLRLKNDLWSIADLESIADSTGAQQRELTQSYTHAALAEMEPTALSTMEMNPKRSAAYIVVGFFVVVTPLVYLYVVTTTP